MRWFDKVIRVLLVGALLAIFGCANEGGVLPLEQGEMLTQTEAESYEYWISEMDTFITENSDWTYSFNEDAFLASVTDSHPEVIDYFDGIGEASEDTLVIEVLVDGLPIVNEYALEQYQSLQDMPDGAMASTWRAWHWWGYSQCYNGSSADTAVYLASLGALSINLPGIGTIVGWVIAAYAGTMGYLNNACGGFCLNACWGAPYYMWVTCP